MRYFLASLLLFLPSLAMAQSSKGIGLMELPDYKTGFNVAGQEQAPLTVWVAHKPTAEQRDTKAVHCYTENLNRNASSRCLVSDYNYEAKCHTYSTVLSATATAGEQMAALESFRNDLARAKAAPVTHPVYYSSPVIYQSYGIGMTGNCENGKCSAPVARFWRR